MDDLTYKALRKRVLTKRNIRLGMMRHLVVIVDMSIRMNEIDMKPNRFICCSRILLKFVEEFVDQNPISQICLIVTKDKRAERISELNGNLKNQLDSLRQQMDYPCSGEASIQNSLNQAYQLLRHMLPHSSKEVLFISGSLTSCDPTDIHKTIDLLAESNIRCSVIGLSAEVFVCKSLTQKTNGVYSIAMEETHFRDLLYTHLSPLPSEVTQSTLMKMGFPQYVVTESQLYQPSTCVCHVDSDDKKLGFGVSGYYCPQCYSKYCDLPVECKVCSLTLVSSSHLARSYHHLFPVDHYIEVSRELETFDGTCFACQKDISTQPKASKCTHCEQIFCVDCDALVHDIVHVCPGCSSNPILANKEL